MKTAIRNAALAMAFMVFVGWYSGLDMLARGNDQAVTLLIGAMFGAGVFLMSIETNAAENAVVVFAVLFFGSIIGMMYFLG